MDGIQAGLARAYPRENANRVLNVALMREVLVAEVRPALLVLGAAVGFVLLIACANVANLLLARATARHRELAIRGALGAGRGRILRQMLTESVVLAACGAAVGLLVAMWALDALVAWIPGDLPIPRIHEVHLDGRVVLFTALAAVLTGILFGLLPALHASRLDLHEALKEGGRSGTDRARQRARNALLVGEVALSLLLLVGAGLMMRSFHRLSHADPGFRAEGLLTASVTLPDARYPDERAQARFYRQMLDGMAALPGVTRAAVALPTPFSSSNLTFGFTRDDRPPPEPGHQTAAAVSFVSEDYFQTMGIPLLRGRVMTRADEQESAPAVVILSEAMAKEYYPGEDPIGKRLTIGYAAGNTKARSREIIGIVGDAEYGDLTARPRPRLYTPIAETGWNTMYALLRTAGPPTSLASGLRGVVRAIDADQPVDNIRPMTEQVGASLARERLTLALLGVFALLALVLAGVGIYGVMSYTVTQRTHEIGVRMALGARPAEVLRLVVGQGLRLALAGVAVGLVGSLALTRLLRGMLFGISPHDPLTYATLAILLGAVAALASFVPARRATKVDPMVALRYE